MEDFQLSLLKSLHIVLWSLILLLFLHSYCNSFEISGAGLVQGFENMWLHFACWCVYSVFSRVPLFWIQRNLKDTIVTFLITDSPLDGTLFFAMLITVCFQRHAVDWQSVFFLTEWFHFLSSTVYYMASKL